MMSIWCELKVNTDEELEIGVTLSQSSFGCSAMYLHKKGSGCCTVLEGLVINRGCIGGLHSIEVAFALLTQQPWVRVLALQRYFSAV